jgi:glutamyl-Q tRNA(Asp) synthetase
LQRETIYKNGQIATRFRASQMPAPVFRFAPSPTGHLHLGHALSALTNYEAARDAGGRFLLRIEDIDPTRCKPEFERSIYEDLKWLGLEWETPVRRQSQHFEEYAAALGRLEAEGLLYASYETRADLARLIASRDPEGGPRYARDEGFSQEETKIREARGDPFALRLDMQEALSRMAAPIFWNENGQPVEAEPARWGDVVLGRKETPASYHLAVVLDDALQGITHIVRGKDLYEATAVHRVLQELLGFPAPHYAHHRLLLDEHGKKLSKRDKSTTLRDLRAGGWTVADVKKAAGF